MKLQIVGHPVKQMQRRGVTRADIEHALLNFHTKFETRDNSVTYMVQESAAMT